MKYLSICVETTGADPIKCDVLECGMIVEDTKNPLSYEELPKLRFWIDKEFYRGSPFSLVAQADILKKICSLRQENSKRLIKPDDACDKILTFLKPHFAEGLNFKAPVVTAGFNFTSLGRRFLSKLKGFGSLPFAPNSLEVTSQFVNWDDDGLIPSFSKCKQLAGLPPAVSHDTLDSSWGVIQILRTKYNKGAAPAPVLVK